MQIHFATENAGKLVSPRRVLAGYGIDVLQYKPDPAIIEIQADTAREVAAWKAKQAFFLLGKPVMTIDSGFFITALAGYPGIYVKPTTERFMKAGVGVQGYFKLLRTDDGWLDPACYFEDVIAFMDGDLDEPMCFARQEHGTLLPSPAGADNPKAKSELWKVFVPRGACVALAEMKPPELEAYRTRLGQEQFYHDFAKWLVDRVRAP